MKRILIFILLLVLIPLNTKALSAHSTIVTEMNSERTLFANNAEEKRLIASITKIMTCIIVLENANLNKEVTVKEEVLKMYGTNIYIEVGEKITIKDLLYGLMLRSGNDAAITLAVNTFPSEEKFVEAMNKKAKEIGMNNTTFKNPHGLDENTKNYSTAADMAKLSLYAYKNKIYREIIRTKKYTCKSSLKSYSWYNRMYLINNYKYCIGGKNGYTPSAGKTLVSLAKKDDLTLGIVTLDDSDIYENHTALYEKYFSLYKMYTIVDKDNFSLDSSFVSDKVYLKESFKYPLKESELKKISTIVEVLNNPKGDIVGKVTIKLSEKEIGSINIYKEKEPQKSKSIFQRFKELITR